ncbi:unnamed protein product [Rhizophagus irregularis]|nr:unnamed protein product [Rhizophagus irregularis]
MSLKRILTSKTSVYLLRDIVQAQSDSRPYTIYFIGVTVLSTTKSEGIMRLAISDYIWEIPIKDFLTASDEVQRSCLVPKLSLNLSKKYFALFFQSSATSWLD